MTVAFIIFSLFWSGAAYAGLHKQTPYTPPSAKQYGQLKKIFPNFTDKDIEKSIKLSKKRENIELINNILIFLKYKGLIKGTEKLPPIFLAYSANDDILTYKGGLYFDNKNIIVLNANLLMANSGQRGQIPANAQTAIDFVDFSAILSHELMHYEDSLKVIEVKNMEPFALSERKAYKISEKSLDYFLKMPKAEAEEIIPVADFYNSMQALDEYFTDMRKNYIKAEQAADIFLNNEEKIRKTFGIDKKMFKLIPFLPQLQFNAKNGGSVMRVESYFLNFPQTLKFNIDTLTGTLDILNTPEEVEEIRVQAKNVKIIDKNSYLILR